jgi:hypothetical protein
VCGESRLLGAGTEVGELMLAGRGLWGEGGRRV